MKISVPAFLLPSWLFFFVGITLSLPARAVTLYHLDFEPGHEPTGTFMGIGNDGNLASGSTVNTDGVGGGRALTGTYGANGGTTFFVHEFIQVGSLVPATSDDRSGYTISFDIRAAGLIVPAVNGNFYLGFQTGTGGGRVVVQGTPWLKSPDFVLTETFQTISFTLDQCSLVSGTFRAANVSVQVDFQYMLSGIASKFGIDAGNQIIVDNFTLTEVIAVPEPAASAGLAGFGMLALACGARRLRR